MVSERLVTICHLTKKALSQERKRTIHKFSALDRACAGIRTYGLTAALKQSIKQENEPCVGPISFDAAPVQQKHQFESAFIP